ncbi:hypothetical protein H4R18_000482 [Coemansia javaensis]|uniref:Hyaluronan-mediated motility receptor C-terminal domain-containing protein n=1 Tax=Coemansia javaensis TaxID=2761396 RepID=A0A9W8LN06_9FUNG|nr:hypothetical protein H4R18_000482 [Coemansia javaensis]
MDRMNYYPGGRRIFEEADPDIPPPGAYDVYSPEARYKKYGFISQESRFRADERQRAEGGGGGGAPALSRAGSISSGGTAVQRPAGSAAATAMRAEEQRQRREIEGYKKRLHDMQVNNERDTRLLREKVEQAEERIKELLRERTDVKKRLLQRETELKAKDRERELLAVRLERQSAMPAANPKAEKQLRDNAEQASSMCAKLKDALDKARRTSEEDKRRMRQLESALRRAAQDKAACEEELRKLAEMDYPRQVSRAEKELRAQEEQFREQIRKLGVSLQEAKDLAARYMNELGEATVHNTALENELQLARERERDAASGTGKQLDAAMAQLSATQVRMGDLERLSAQRAAEAGRLLDAANDHVEELKAEIARLEQEREQVQREMQGRIRDLTRDYQSAKREFESSVKDADSERTRRLHDTQTRLERATKETIDLKAEVSELRGILLKKEMAWKDRQLELEGDLQAAASDYEALQTQFNDQHAALSARIKGLEEQAQKRERAWGAERTGILEKLDTAHKDGFKLREALDALQKDAAQTKADCDSDLKRVGREMADLRAEADAHHARWEEERRELVRSHADEVAELKEECAVLEQQLQDDRFELGTQLGEARGELEAQAEAHREQLESLRAQAADATDALEKQVLAKQRLEERLASSDARAAARIAELEEQLDKARLEHEQSAAGLQRALQAAEQRAADCEDEAHAERAEAEALRAENAGLADRVERLAAANAELTAELDDGAAWADEQRDEALAHQAQLLQAVADKHRAGKAQWAAEREALQARLDRYKFREHLWAIQEHHMQTLIEITEDARVHMVQEARSLYCELQDEAAAADGNMDAGEALADDLQRLLALPADADADADAADLERQLAEVRDLARAVLAEGVQRAQDAAVARVRAEAAAQEARLMRVQGQVVEAAGEMSAQHKAERARLEGALDSARSDYRGLQELATANRAALEARAAELQAQAAELQARLGELEGQAGGAEDAARLETENAELRAQVERLGDYAAELEAQLEVADYAADDERAGTEQQRAALEARNAHMTRVLEQCEVDMAAQVEQISSMSQHIAELESERAIMAEQTQFQISWLKENYSKAYQDLDSVLSNGGGHSNLRQRIRYVESLKSQILALKRECLEASRERDRHRHAAALLRSELEAYKEVSDADALQAQRGTARGWAAPHSARPTGAAAAAAAERRAALGRKGAAVARSALDDAQQLQKRQMAVVDDAAP